MLTRFSRWSAMTLAIVLMGGLAPGLVPAAHADSVAWARQLSRDFRAAQRITKGKGVTVAILASGVDGRVPSLRGSVLRGRDFVRTPRPKRIFGTLVASLIAGSGPTHDSPFGMRGLAPGVKILPVRVEPDWEDPGAKRWFRKADPWAVLAKGIRHAADQGAQVIWIDPNYSGDADVTAFKAAVAYAQSKNAVVVAGNGRTNRGNVTGGNSSAGAPGVIGVAPVTEKGQRYRKYSQDNSRVLVAAPGFELPSVGPGNSLWTFWGGGQAAAWVAAAVALVRSEYPRLPADQVVQAIARSARHPKGGYNTQVGFGIINPIGALRRARALDAHPPATVATANVMPDKAHFGGGEPETIDAVRHDVWLLAGLSALTAAGLVIFVLALVLALRGRRRTAVVADGAHTSFAPATVDPMERSLTPEDRPADHGETPPESSGSRGF